MSAPDEPRVPQPLDPAKMDRLALIRLLYLQGVEQSRQPRPLSAASILTFHDTTELFLILAAEHLQAGPITRDSSLLQYWTVLRSRRGFTGVELSGQHGIGRLISVRNDVKHLGKLPSPEDIVDARSSVTGFLEDNTPKVFGLEFASIDMADVVPQEKTRTHIKAAAAAKTSGDRTEAMAQLAEAFRDLFDAQVGYGRGTFSFGATIQHQPWAHARPMVDGLANGARYPQNLRTAQHAADQLDRQVKSLTETVRLLQSGLRVIALGIDPARYDRFHRITPTVYFSGEHRQVHVPNGYAPTQEEFDECTQFVIDAALREAQVQAYARPPSWRPT
jgi:hypothetical protein